MTKRYHLLSFIVFLALIYYIANHQVQQIRNDSPQIITTYVNQAKSIIIPYKKCFKVQPELQANLQFIDFKPTKVALSPLISFSIKEVGSKISILDQLRSPTILKHRDLLIFDNYLMILFAPNIILIVEETKDKFRIKNQYKIQNLEPYDQFKMYKIQDRAILIIYNKNKIYLLNEVDYQDYELPNLSSIFHIEQTGQSFEFYAAQNNLGLTHYKLNQTSRKVEIIQRLNGHSIGLPQHFNYIVDVNLRMIKQKNKIYALDKQNGLIQIDLSKERHIGKIIVNQRNCESFDMLNEQHFVLICQNQGRSTIIQAHIYFDKKSNSYKYRKIEPLFQVNYYNDLHLTQDYYIVYSYKALQFFWNSKKNRLPEILESQGQILLPGLQTFAMKRQKTQNILYTIESGQLNKYVLLEEKASLKIKSNRILTKNFKLYMFGNCQDLNNQFEQDNAETCKVIKDISLNVIEQQYPRQKDYSISAIIITILITIFLLLIWICLKKYKGLQKQARKLLQTYQKKKNNKRRGI